MPGSLTRLGPAKVNGEARSDHWNFVLPMARYPSKLIAGMASPVEYPRVPLLRAIVHYVADDLARR